MLCIICKIENGQKHLNLHLNYRELGKNTQNIKWNVFVECVFFVGEICYKIKRNSWLSLQHKLDFPAPTQNTKAPSLKNKIVQNFTAARVEKSNLSQITVHFIANK